MSSAHRLRARVYCVGTELLTNASDRHGPSLAARLDAAGLRVVERRLLEDDRSLLEAAMERALAEPGLTVVTGGLGPTDDDLTRDALASAAGVELHDDERIAAGLHERVKAWGREEASERVLRQAQVPEGATVLDNPVGSAPGLLFDKGASVVLLLPGPPHELAALLDGGALDRAIARADELDPDAVLDAWPRRKLILTGMGESSLNERIESLVPDEMVLAILAGQGRLSLELKARDAAVLDETMTAVKKELGRHVVSDDGRTLEEVLVAILTERFESLGTVESCTGGGIAAAITSVPGSSEIFKRGLVTYSNDAKQQLLGVPAELLAEHGAVSRPVAEAMAVGGRLATESDFCLSVTGIAGPGGGSEEKPVGLVHFGLSLPDGTVVHREKVFEGDRGQVRARSVAHALDLLWWNLV
ncbi:MAG: nicotinamide-nucleotide amidohydrolase family protein [Acidobacteriota bacterium]